MQEEGGWFFREAEGSPTRTKNYKKQIASTKQFSNNQFSKKKRHLLLRRTAKQFFLNTLEIDNFHHLQSFMSGEQSAWPRIKTALDFRDKNKSVDGNP